VGPVEADVWKKLERFAPTARQRHAVLRAALEALVIRYAGPVAVDDLRLPFAALLDDEKAVRRSTHRANAGALLQIAIEAVPALENAQDSGLDLCLVYLEGASHCGWRFPEGAWSTGRIERFHQQFWHLLRNALETPNQPVGALEYLAGSEKALVTGPWAGTPNYDQPYSSAIHRFEEIARQWPDRIAIVCGREQINYRAINESANRLAHYLMYFSVRPSTIVAVALPESLELAIAILAIQKLGAVAMPLDPSLDEQSRNTHLELFGNALVISNGAFAAPKVLDLSREAAAICSQASTNPGTQIRAEHAAEIVQGLAPSGAKQSTLLLHRSILHAALDTECLPFRPNDVVLRGGRTGSAQASFEFWAALLNGSRLVLPLPHQFSPKPLHELARKHKATFIYLQGAHLERWLRESSETLAQTDKLVIGAPVAPKLRDRLLRLRKKGTQLEALGGAETSLLGMLRWLKPGVETNLIGHPRQAMAAYALDPAGSPVAIGALGELCLEGPGLAWGYLEEKADCAAAFQTKDFGQGEGGRYFRTGELVRWNEDGKLEHVGRLNQRVSFEGVKVDLFAIERELRRAPQVRDCAVVVRQVAGHLKRLVAYVELESPIVNIRRVLREFLAESLPEHYLPSDFLVMNSLPLTRDGELDRALLSAPALGPEVSDAEADARALESGAGLTGSRRGSRKTLWQLWKEALPKL
jgi:acyl-CoA synthetase (AMP-forming)/AMP-acid ligase II